MGELHVPEEYLQEVIDEISKRTVGKVMKRHELFGSNRPLKAVTKELIYEGFREIKDILSAYNEGFEISVFKFNKGDHSTK